MTGVRTGVVTDGDGVTAAVAVAAGDWAGGDPEHPQVNMSRRTMVRSTGTVLIHAGQRFPYNNVMVNLMAGLPRTFIMRQDGP